MNNILLLLEPLISLYCAQLFTPLQYVLINDTLLINVYVTIMLFGFNVSTPSLYPMHRLFSSRGLFARARRRENKRCTCVGYSLLVIREMESFVVSAAAKRWIGKSLLHCGESYLYLFLPLE